MSVALGQNTKRLSCGSRRQRSRPIECLALSNRPHPVLSCNARGLLRPLKMTRAAHSWLLCRIRSDAVAGHGKRLISGCPSFGYRDALPFLNTNKPLNIIHKIKVVRLKHHLPAFIAHKNVSLIAFAVINRLNIDNLSSNVFQAQSIRWQYLQEQPSDDGKHTHHT